MTVKAVHPVCVDAVPPCHELMVNVCPGRTISRYFPVPATCESDQKLVTSLLIQAIVSVQGFPDVLKIFTAPVITLPVIAWTRTPVIVKISEPLSPQGFGVVIVAVTVVAVTDIVAALISCPAT